MALKKIFFNLADHLSANMKESSMLKGNISTSQFSDSILHKQHKQIPLEFINFEYLIKSLALSAFTIKSNELQTEVDKVTRQLNNHN